MKKAVKMICGVVFFDSRSTFLGTLIFCRPAIISRSSLQTLSLREATIALISYSDKRQIFLNGLASRKGMADAAQDASPAPAVATESRSGMSCVFASIDTTCEGSIAIDAVVANRRPLCTVGTDVL